MSAATYPRIETPALDPPMTPPARSDSSARLYALDILRFIAASLVVGFHAVPMVGAVYGVNVDAYFGHAIAQATRYGWIGVNFFFVISGFVICMSSWGRRVSQFATSRATRLFPAYILAVLVTAAILTLSPVSPETPSLVQVLVNLTMFQDFAGVPHLDGVYWTLTAELKFYMIFALVVWAGVTYRRVVAFCGIWLVGAMIAEESKFQLLIGLLQPRWAPFFVAGIVLYLMWRFGPTMLLWLMLAASAALGALSIEKSVPEVLPGVGETRVTVALACFAAFLGVMIAITRGWTSWMRWRGLVTIGALTYPLYLLHYHLVYWALRTWRDDLPAWLLMSLAIVGVLALAYLVHLLVERPGSRILRRGLQHSFEQMRPGARTEGP